MLSVNSWDRESWSREDEDCRALDKGATCVVQLSRGMLSKYNSMVMFVLETWGWM